jgi:predicted nucleotidyltransferase
VPPVSRAPPRRIRLGSSRERLLGQSDIHLLVEYQVEHHPPSLNDYLVLRDALAELLGRRVDLVMDGAVNNPYVLAGIETLQAEPPWRMIQRKTS